VEFNAAAEHLLGYDRESLAGTSWEKICPPTGNRPLLRDILSGTGPEPSFETTLVRRDGSLMDAEFTISALHDNASRVIGAVYIGRDITHAKTMRRELIQAEKMASIGQVASWIAHQIRNVLGRLLMHLSALRPPEEGSPFLKKVHQEFITGIREMNMLVTDLLEYSKTLSLHPAPMKLNQILDGLIETHTRDSRGGRLQIERHYDADLPQINADVFKLEQAIGNILKNAQDAMPQGGTLHLTTRQDPPSSSITVIIEDSGTGILPDDLPRIFRPFFTTKSNGTGLGLAMAARIIEVHGGSIRADNRPQGGASFSFTLPLTPRKATNNA
jgi:PAS domain S-box-containing protein